MLPHPITSPGRGFVILLALLVLSVLPRGAVAANASPTEDGGAPPFVTSHWKAEHAYLTALIGCVRDGTWSQNPWLLDEHAAVRETDRDAADVVLRRTRGLLDHLRALPGAPGLDAELRQMKELEDRGWKPAVDQQARRDLFFDIVALRRRITLANPLLDFDEILFMNARAPYTGHVSGIGPVANNSLAYSSTGDLNKRGLDVPAHIASGRIAYMMTDWYDPPSGRDGAPWVTPRLRSEVYSEVRWQRPVRKASGLMALRGFKEGQPELEPVLASMKVTEGPNADVPLADGIFAHDWDLHFEGQKVVFSWIHRGMPNVYVADLESGEVRQLTDTVWGDFDPTFLPDERIVFRSSRRFVIDRCQPWDHEDYTNRHCATLYSMAADGSDQVPLSWHETNEAHPAVDNDGRLVFSRWDYIDRGFNAAQHIWHSFPDGRDPRAFHGNYSRPYWKGDSKENGSGPRPFGEFQAQPLPGESAGKYLLLSSGHHATGAGNPIIVDTTIPDDGASAQIKQIVDGIGLPGDHSGAGFTSVWPLSDSYYLVSLSGGRIKSSKKGMKLPPLTGARGLFLLDRFGNLEPLVTNAVFDKKYSHLETFWSPYPRRARRRPPVIPPATFQGERHGSAGHKRATMAVMNVYEADFAWPQGRTPTELRVVRLWGRPWARPGGHYPEIGYCKGSVGRLAVGTAPIEKDGSAYLEAPVGCQLYFQVLDQDGLAIQSMRSGTFVRPGEQLTCTGCHENKWQPRPPSSMPLAMQRAPSRLRPEVGGPYPQTFARLVKPLFEGKCLGCHTQQNRGRKEFGYFDLEKVSWRYPNGGLAGGTKYSRSTAGEVGAAGSRLGRELMKTHRQRLTADELRRVTLWLDLNSGAISDYMHEEEQVLGRIVWPWEAVDLLNPQQFEHDRPLPLGVIPDDGLPGALRLARDQDYQRRHVGYEALRQLGTEAASARGEVLALVRRAIAEERILECEPLLRAARAIDEKTCYREGVGVVAELVTGDDASRAFTACQTLRFLGADTEQALAAYGQAVQAEDYDLALAAAETIVGLGARAAPIAAKINAGLQSPHHRVAALLARALRKLDPATPGVTEALVRVLRERRGDYTWLGKPAEELAKIPAVQERHALLTGTVYENPKVWGERQPAMLSAACNVERGWPRKLITAAVRTLETHGAQARAALPELVACAAHDSGDLPALVRAACAIDHAGTIAATSKAFAQFGANPDTAVRLVTFLGRLVEELPDKERAAGLQALAALRKLDGVPGEEVAHWLAVLKGEKPPKREKKKKKK